MRKKVKTSSIGNNLREYIKNNVKEYILVFIIFLIGIFIGIMFINNCSDDKIQIVNNYISEFVERFKSIEIIDKIELIKSSLKNNIALSIIIWLAGTTIIGIPIVLGVILFRGFCLGYTISAITCTMGIKTSILFCFITLFLQNILFIPAIITMGVSSIKLYKAIINDRRKENIKIEIIRHTIISLMMLGILIISSLVENEISVNLLKFGIKYIN